MKYVKPIKFYFCVGIIFVLILGTLSHFFYGWSGNNRLVGLFSPVNESTWEHMKLLFFPMVLYSLFLIYKLRSTYPSLPSALFTGILAGTFMIPVLFYTYSGILGYNILFLDIATFAISVLFAFYLAHRLTISYRMQDYTMILMVLLFIVMLCFIIFTYHAPDIGLFDIPAQ